VTFNTEKIFFFAKQVILARSWSAILSLPLQYGFPARGLLREETCPKVSYKIAPSKIRVDTNFWFEHGYYIVI
jgi:hypothetical protein